MSAADFNNVVGVLAGISAKLGAINKSLERWLKYEEQKNPLRPDIIKSQADWLKCSVCFGYFTPRDMLSGILEGGRFCRGCGYPSESDRVVFEEMDEEMRRELDDEEEGIDESLADA